MTTMVLPSFSGRLRDGHGGKDRGSGGDADEDAFLAGAAAGPLDGLLAGHFEKLIDDAEVENVGDEARANSLNDVLAWNDFLVVFGLA